MLSKGYPFVTELSITYEPEFTASFATELGNSKKSLDISNTRPTGLAFKIVPEPLNHSASAIFALAVGSARLMGAPWQSSEFSLNN